MYENETRAQRALLVSVDTGEYDAESSLNELEELCRTAGADPALTVMPPVPYAAASSPATHVSMYTSQPPSERGAMGGLPWASTVSFRGKKGRVTLCVPLPVPV